ncbi:unnamed protein product [Chondrus crispus]|uniref:Glucosidase 2 subunit beta n=1 Tax=Chondrus crispus TaxID=2769 RepID=R7QJG0_CHOCR|nr:unnamed protein product [Chondrus crispus]CDF37888.1 unnamed protein product [Chondrus crispus]|eukprot:XP_005717759.1 unnamed protein product [Chondrus crispus]
MLVTPFIQFIAAILLCRDVNALRGAHPLNTTALESGIVCAPRDAPGHAPVSIPPAKLNDDYCDCADGSDEPGTAACPGAVFWCRNKAFRPVKLPSSWVDDGSCDCCDGSDEPAGTCTDTCSEERKKQLAMAKKQADAIIAGVATRQKYAKEAASDAKKDEREIKNLEQELERVEIDLKRSGRRADSLRKRRDYEDDLRRAAETNSPSPTSNPATDTGISSDEDSDDGDDAFIGNHDDHGNDGERNLELQTGDKEGGHDDHPDEKVKVKADAAQSEIENESKSDHKSHDDIHDDTDEDSAAEDDDVANDEDEDEDYSDDDDESFADDEDDDDKCPDCEEDGEEDEEKANAEEWNSDADDIDVDMVCAELGADGLNSILRKLNYYKIIVLSKLQRLLPISPPALIARERISDCVEKADTARYKLEDKKRHIQERLKKLKGKTSLDYGSDGALRKLHGKCIKKAVTQYEFEICPFDLVRQYEHGSVIAVLGRFKGWKGDGRNRLMNFAQGDRCWNGPARSIKVELSCGDTEEIVSVEEPNRCAYFMKFKTPAFCEKAAADAILADFEETERPKEEL